MKRYIETFLASKSDTRRLDLYNFLQNSLDIDLSIFNLYIIEKKKMRFSYKLIGIKRSGNSSKYIDALLIGHHLISITFNYDDFIEFQRDIKIKKIL
jgi:hypothetical protein